MNRRKRIYKGTLVASTNSLNRILSKRFVVTVVFKNNYQIISYDIGKNRNCILE
jgi:hypothetical protein